MRAIHAVVLLVSSCLALLSSPDAFGAQLTTEVGSRRIGVGQGVEVKITVTQEDGDPEPQNPQLTVRGQAQLRGPSVGSQRRVTMRNFSFDSEKSVVATWVVTPTAKGKIVIGPGSFVVGGKTLRGETIVLEVTDEPQAAPQRGRFGGGSIFGPDPRDIFGDDPFDTFSRGRAPGVPEAPPEYRLETAADPTCFLHVILDKKKVVLGEPVRVTVLAYGSRGNFREVSPNEPSLSDFLSYSVIETSHEEPAFQTIIGGQQYLVRKLREYILIPLKTGPLTIGGMTAVVQGARGSYPVQGSPLGMKVVGPSVTVQVAEPPLDNRPAGYFPGDVGNYKLAVDVNPRTIKQGEYVEVIVQVRGAGQIPSKILLPEAKHLVWEPPTLSGGPEIRDGELQGVRVLKYALQINQAGDIPLGEISLPFFNHKQHAYRIARAELGHVQVDKSAAPEPPAPMAPSADDKTVPEGTGTKEGLPFAPRRQAQVAVTGRGTEAPRWAWWILWGAPGLLFLGGALRRAGQRLVTNRKGAPKSRAADHLREAKRSFADKKEMEGYRSLERALYESLDQAIAQKTRGHLRERLAEELVRAGMNEKLASQCQEFLLEIEALRYDPHFAKSPDPVPAATEIISQISRAEKSLTKNRATQESPS